MFGYSGLSVNSDLPCMFCFNNKIFTVMPKKKKNLWSIWVKVFVLIMVFSVCCWIRVGIRSPFKLVRVLMGS